jgi:hypothetical protein
MCRTSRLVHQNSFHINSTMSFHPTGVVLEIVGTDVPDQGRSCEEHMCCGHEVLKEDVVVRLRKTVVEINGKEERAIEAVWVTDGCDRCRVGFLQRHMTFYSQIYDSALAQVTAILSSDANVCNSEERRKYYRMRGCCRVTIISMHGSTGHADNGNDNNDDSGSGSNEEDESDDDNNDDEEPLQTQPLTPQKRALEDQ